MNTDTIVAIGLLVLCGVFLNASFDIPDMGYESIGAGVWPRLILGALSVLSLVYLVRSVRAGVPEGSGRRSLGGLIVYYQNALWCYGIFALFLVTLDYLGMLIGGTLFVFLTLTALGRRGIRDHVNHALIAVVSMGAMWAIFTFGLKVFLPEGEILKIW